MQKSISYSTLKGLAGDAAYKRGEAYFRDGRVAEMDVSGSMIHAVVEGTENYVVSLRHTAKIFEGSCNCPASDNFDFCKHCVAAGLKYLDQLEAREVLKSSGKQDLLRNYLQSLDKTALVNHLLTHIEEDRQLREEWMLKAELAAGKLDAKSFRKRITSALPYRRNLYRYRDVRSYFARVDVLTQQFTELAPRFSAAEVLALVDYALKRMSKVLEHVDDSGGFRLDSQERLWALHNLAVAEVDWSKPRIAKYLLDIYLDEAAEMYPEIPGEYCDVLGAEGLECLVALARERWDAMDPPKARGGPESEWQMLAAYRPLQRLLVDAARQEKDIETEIEVLAKTAIQSDHMLDISSRALAAGRMEQAVEWYEKAVKHKPDAGRWYMRERLANHKIDILCGQGKFAEAMERLWAMFSKNPSMQTFNRLLKVANDGGDTTDWHQKAIDLLIEGTPDRRGIGVDEIIVDLLLGKGEVEKAVAFAGENRLPEYTVLEVARAATDISEEVLNLYLTSAELNIRSGQNNGYREAIALLGEVEQRMPDSMADQFQVELCRIHTQYRAKRNFRQWLEEAYPVLVGQ